MTEDRGPEPDLIKQGEPELDYRRTLELLAERLRVVDIDASPTDSGGGNWGVEFSLPTDQRFYMYVAASHTEIWGADIGLNESHPLGGGSYTSADFVGLEYDSASVDDVFAATMELVATVIQDVAEMEHPSPDVYEIARGPGRAAAF